MKVEGVLGGVLLVLMCDAGPTAPSECLLTLQMPQATVHSSLVAEAWLAWHSIPTTTAVSHMFPW